MKHGQAFVVVGAVGSPSSALPEGFPTETGTAPGGIMPEGFITESAVVVWPPPNGDSAFTWRPLDDE